jgi:hypothetical protein
MHNVIVLADVLHRRRVASATAELEALLEAQNAKRRAALHDSADRAGAGLAGHIIADAIANVEESERERERASRYVPAYCDPDNERRGAKFEATRGLSTKEIAARIRADIKAAQKAGTLDARFKISTRCEYFSGGSSIDCRITHIPDDVPLFNPDYLRHEVEHATGAFNPYRGEYRSAQVSAALATISEIHGAYNRDNSDSMTDYFCVRYYGDVGIDWQVEAFRRKFETAAALSAEAQA